MLRAASLAFFLPAILAGHPGPDSASVFQVGEELIYNVSYAGLDIGQIRLRVIDAGSGIGKNAFHARSAMDSYEGIPFVNLHTVYETHISRSGHSVWFMSRNKEDERWTTHTYRFNYMDHRVVVEDGTWKSPIVEHRDTLHIDTVYQDGLSLFYFARRHLVPGARYSVPTLVSEKMGRTEMNIADRPTHESIDAIPYPVDVLECEGEASFVGVFGFSGHFEGWFSNDEARIPILAKLKVLIGTVRVELMKWRRTGWVPPKYVEEVK